MRALRAFRSVPFRIVWAGLLSSQLGFWIGTISLQWVMARQTHADAFSQGLLFFFSFTPLLVASPFAGLIADRFERRSIAVAGQLGLAAAAAVLAVVTALHMATVPFILVMALVLGTLSALASPAVQALVANSVPVTDIASAVSLQTAGTHLGRIAGPALAAPVLITFGAGPTFAVTAVANLITAGALTRAPIPRHARTASKQSWRRTIVAGFRHAAERKPALTFLGMVMVTMTFGACFTALMPTFAYQVLNAGDLGFSELVIATGIGAAVGATVSGYREDQAKVRTIALAMLGLGAALVGVAAIRYFPLVLVLAALVGALNYVVQTGIATSLQYLSAEEMRGRMMSIYQLVGPGALPIGGLAVGALARVIGPGLAVGAFAAVLCTIALGLVVRFSFHSRPATQLPEAAELT